MGPAGQEKLMLEVYVYQTHFFDIYVYISGAVRWSKTSSNKIGETRLRESKPRSKCVWVHKARGNESYICWCHESARNGPNKMLEKLGEAERNELNNFGETR